MKITKQELTNLWRAFEALSKKDHPVKFSYFISKNKSIIRDEIEILNELTKASESYMLYDGKRVELAKELSNKDEAGNPIIKDDAYVIVEKKEEFDKQLGILREANKDVIDEHTKKMEELQKLLQEDYEFEGYATTLDNLPDVISPELMDMFLKAGIIED